MSSRAPYDVAVEYLSRREHSVKELTAKLLRKFPSQIEAVTNAVTRVQTLGYLSDLRFAEAYARSRGNRGFGPQRIAQELRYKGIEDAIVDQVLSDLASSTDYAESSLYTTWHKKFGTPPEDLKEKQKQFRYLRYRGYSYEQIQDLLDRLGE